MSDKTTQDNTKQNENAEMAHNEEMDDVLSNVLNADDSRTSEALSEGNDEETDKLRAEIAELRDKHIRMVAEFDNFRRRSARERLDMQATASRDVIQSLLTVLDDVDRAAKQMETTTDISVLKEGISLVFNKLRTTMLQKGLKKMDATGQEFNPDLHEAITEIPVTDEALKGKVIDVVDPGYYLNDKLIRHAKVVVGK